MRNSADYTALNHMHHMLFHMEFIYFPVVRCARAALLLVSSVNLRYVGHFAWRVLTWAYVHIYQGEFGEVLWKVSL